MNRCFLAYEPEEMRHLICFEGRTDNSSAIGSLKPGSPFLEVINAKNAYDIMNCAELLGTYGFDTYSPVEDPTTEELVTPIAPVLAVELHGSNPTQAQLKAAERAVRKWGNPINTNIAIAVEDFYSVSVLLRAALVLDSFARNRCPCELSLAEFERSDGFDAKMRLGPDGHGALFWTLKGSVEGLPCPVNYGQDSMLFLDEQGNDVVSFSDAIDRYNSGKHRKLLENEGIKNAWDRKAPINIHSSVESSGQNGRRKAAQKLADTIFSLYLGGRNQKRDNGSLCSYSLHALCDKYAELAKLCEDNRIGVCAKCGKVFISEKPRGKQRLYCSDSCRVTKWQSNHSKPSDAPSKPPTAPA
jgi:hypothetical protein